MPAFDGENKDASQKPIHELMTRSLVDLYVGPENNHWIIHEKLLCERSAFFRQIFQKAGSSPSASKSFGLPEEDDEPFRQFIGWLYSGHVAPPKEEADLTPLFDLYLMGEKWQVPALEKAVLEAVRHWYWMQSSYPGLRRVQYIYANTQAGSPMRALLVSSVARMLALGDGIPKHWDKALRKNGQLAVDIIQSMQGWKLDPARVPDLRQDPLDEAGVDPEQKELDESKLDAEVGKVFQQNGGLENLPNGISEHDIGEFNGTQMPNGTKEVNGINGINGVNGHLDY